MSLSDLHNPFCLEPVRTPEQFFGREKETRRVLGFLQRGQSVSVQGPAKMGKTSFLFHVAHPQVREQFGLAQEQLFVYLDCHLLAGRDQGQCYSSILEETLRQVKDTESVDKTIGIKLEKVVREAEMQTYLGLQTLFRTAQARGLKLVMILDDFEFLANNRYLDAGFFSALRSLPTAFEMAYLVASRSSLDKLERITSGSPFFNIVASMNLMPLSREASLELVVTLLHQADIEFPQFAVDCILELGNNEPYRLQKAGHIAFQVWQDNKRSWQEQHCEKVKRRFAQDEHYAKQP